MGMSEKLVEVSENVPKVFEAGKQAEYDRFWDNHPTKNGAVVDSECLFAGASWNDITFNPKYDINPKTCYMIFRSSTITDIVESLKSSGVVLNFKNVTNFQYGFTSMRSKHIGEIYLTHENFTQATYFTAELFSWAQLLHTIDKIILNSKGTTLIHSAAFNQTISLQNITFEGVIGCCLDFRHSPLSRASITNIIEHLSSTATGQTVTFKKSAKEAAFTDDEWEALKATKPNWTITLI